MKACLTAPQQFAVKKTIADLLTADEKAAFGIDRWQEHFRNASQELLPTGLVPRFNPFEPEEPVWPTHYARSHRVVAALALRGVLGIIDAVSRLEEQKYELQSTIVKRDRAGLDAQAERAHVLALHLTITENRLSRGDVWRRGFVMSAEHAWKELFALKPARSKLDCDGISLAEGIDMPWSFDRFLIDVWAETRTFDRTIQRLSFSGIKPLSLEK